MKKNGARKTQQGQASVLETPSPDSGMALRIEARHDAGLEPRLSNGSDLAISGNFAVPKTSSVEHMRFSDDMSWFADFLGPVPRGAAVIASGPPGVGKSGIALQAVASADLAGERALIISTEQSAGALYGRLHQIQRPLGVGTDSAPVEIIDTLSDFAMLPRFLASHVFNTNGRYHATTFLVLDSLHGAGICANDRRSWEPIYESLRLASAAGLVTLALAHMTKSRQIAGPRTLEHNVDTVLMMRHGVSARALTIPKNRNAPSRMEPLSLALDPDSTRLEPSPLSDSATARVRTIASDGIVEIEAALSLPRHDRGFVKSPRLAAREVETIVDVLERALVCCRHLWAIGITVRGPAGLRQSRDHNLAIAAAILAALHRIQIPEDMIFLGDLSLDGVIQTPSSSTLGDLKDTFEAEQLENISVVANLKTSSIETVLKGASSVNAVNRLEDLLEVLGGGA